MALIWTGPGLWTTGPDHRAPFPMTGVTATAAEPLCLGGLFFPKKNTCPRHQVSAPLPMIVIGLLDLPRERSRIAMWFRDILGEKISCIMATSMIFFSMVFGFK